MLKKKIREIYTPTVIGVEPGSLVSETVGLMREHNISCIVVLEDDKPLGIFTERDILRTVADRGPDFLDCKVEEVMKRPVVTCTGDMFVYEAYTQLLSCGLRHLVVVDEKDRVKGMVTESNLIRNLGIEYYLEVRRVDQIMTRDVFRIPRRTLVGSVMKAMAVKSISCAVVVEEDSRPAGVLTERDVARFLLDKPGFDSAPVEQVMSSPVEAVESESPVLEAGKIMEKKNIRRLVVVDGQGRIAGIVTYSDIVRGIENKYIEILKEIIRDKDAKLKATMEELYEKSLYMDSILNSSIDLGIVATDTNWRINYHNPVAEKMLGRRSKDIIGKNLRDLKSYEYIPFGAFDLGRTAVDPGDIKHNFYFQVTDEEGEKYIHARIAAIQDKAGELLGFVLLMRDITERIKAEETIRYMAYHDILTGLPNRALFNDRLNQEITRANRNTKKIGLLLLDLDEFKKVNDTFGHHAGDMLLKGVASRVRQMLRASDTVARVGGDEYMVIIPDLGGADAAEQVAEKIIKNLDEPIKLDGHSYKIQASIGIAVYPDHAEDTEDLIKASDRAMYAAKQKGRRNMSSNVELYSAT